MTTKTYLKSYMGLIMTNRSLHMTLVAISNERKLQSLPPPAPLPPPPPQPPRPCCGSCANCGSGYKHVSRLDSSPSFRYSTDQVPKIVLPPVSFPQRFPFFEDDDDEDDEDDDDDFDDDEDDEDLEPNIVNLCTR